MSLSKRAFPSPSIFDGFDDFFSTPVFPHVPVPFLTDIDRDPDMVLRHSSPCYEITENDKQYQLAVDVPGVKRDDINIELEQDRMLRISGGRKVHTTQKDGSTKTSESKFQKRFVMDESIDKEHVSANLEDGVLTITAPKRIDHKKVQKIAITEGRNPQMPK